jgi:hypothetical protein
MFSFFFFPCPFPASTSYNNAHNLLDVARETLEAAAQSTDQRFVFQSIYRCGSGGRITWSTPCNAPQACQNIPEQQLDSFCRA